MKTAQSYLSQQLQHHFTEEAWSQFEAYLSSLVNQLTQQNISEPQINLTFTGIEEYVVGFAQELKDSKITFRQAIDLIEDLGTPSEIISDLDVITNETPPTDQAFCTECGSQIPANLVYCNNCGRNTTLPSKQFSPFKQAIIDNPYGYAFVLVFAVTIVATLMGALLGVIAAANGYSITVSVDFGFFLLIAVILSFISLIIGWLIDEIYGEYKSFKQRYELIQSYFGTRRFLGHFSVVTAIMVYILGGIFYRNELVGNPEGNISAFWITLLLPFYLLTISSTEDYPGNQEVPYYQLLNLKSQLARKVLVLLVNFNKKWIMPLIILSGIWHVVIFNNYAVDTAYAALPGWFMFVLLLVIFNSIYYAHLHTWRFLRTLVKSV